MTCGKSILDLSNRWRSEAGTVIGYATCQSDQMRYAVWNCTMFDVDGRPFAHQRDSLDLKWKAVSAYFF